MTAGFGAEVHKVQGLVLEVDRAQGLMVVSHRAIPGYMPAMVMPFRAEPANQLDAIAPGARIVFDLVVNQQRSVARRIRPDSGGSGGVEPGGRGAREEFRIPAPKQMLRIGEAVPDFELMDQEGRTVRLSDFRGKTGVAIQFLYTRCPLPDVCPRLAASFAYVHRKLGDRVQLLSITVDPTYDTPAVLRDYARRWKADGEHWRFLTAPSATAAAGGEDAAIQKAGERFGVVFWPEEGAVTHTSATAIVGADGRLKAIVEGSSYRAEQLKDLIERQLLR